MIRTGERNPGRACERPADVPYPALRPMGAELHYVVWGLPLKLGLYWEVLACGKQAHPALCLMCGGLLGSLQPQGPV